MRINIMISNRKRLALSSPPSGFTVIELIIVISVIGILASSVILNYTGWFKSITVAQLSSDLNEVASAMGNARNFENQYPSTFPSSFSVSSGTILQMATADTGEFCINAYSAKYPEILLSFDSKIDGIQQSLCRGLIMGSPIGGTVPTAPRGVNLVADFTQWTLSGGATYNQSSKELTLGGPGYALSPKIRIDKPSSMAVGGDFYAAVASAYSGWVSLGGWHMNIAYFASDGTTPALNSAGYATNGCAKSIPLSVWSLNNTTCTFSGGPNVVYVQYGFYGSNWAYTSSDIKIKNPKLTTVN